jgi:hypothetical protein
MGAGKNKSHRKKRISKHVLEAEERKKQTQLEDKLISAAEGGGDISTETIPAPQPESAKGNSKVKHPEEAALYLTLWNQDRNNKTGAWKFNKNTQSWLLRHMYNSDKVNKTTFGLLVEYICQGGDGTRCRVEEDAKSKALRYKEWEKREQDKGGNGDENDKKESSQQDKKAGKLSDQNEEVWAQLNEHDKRKEYKRARKVMDALKAVREEAANG